MVGIVVEVEVAWVRIFWWLEKWGNFFKQKKVQTNRETQKMF